MVLTAMLHQPFMADAFLAGTAIALAAGLVGYFLLLRAQVFTGDALSHVAFTGALGALALGVDLRIGLFATTIGVVLLLGALGRRGRADDVVIGSVFAWTLGLGVFFLTLYTTSRSTGNGSPGVTVLFGSMFGIASAAATTAAVIAGLIAAAVLAIARPLLFASIDEAVGAACGVPVKLLGFAFLALVGATAAEATEAVGALLLLGLVAAPAGTALLLTDRPYRALGLSAAFAVASMWIGLTASYELPHVQPGFTITATATLFYFAAYADRRVLPVIGARSV